MKYIYYPQNRSHIKKDIRNNLFELPSLCSQAYNNTNLYFKFLSLGLSNLNKGTLSLLGQHKLYKYYQLNKLGIRRDILNNLIQIVYKAVYKHNRLHSKFLFLDLHNSNKALLCLKDLNKMCKYYRHYNFGIREGKSDS